MNSKLWWHPLQICLFITKSIGDINTQLGDDRHVGRVAIVWGGWWSRGEDGDHVSRVVIMWGGGDHVSRVVIMCGGGDHVGWVGWEHVAQWKVTHDTREAISIGKHLWPEHMWNLTIITKQPLQMGVGQLHLTETTPSLVCAFHPC